MAKAEEKRFSLDLGAPLQAAKRAEAASAAAMAIAKLPGVPSSTLKLVRIELTIIGNWRARLEKKN